MRKNLLVSACCLSVALVGCGQEQPQVVAKTKPVSLLEVPVGSVSFPVSCKAEAASLVERGVAFLHHMMYDEANVVFGMAGDKDPDCAMAYWGQAMTLIRPLWPDAPTPAQLERGSQLVDKSHSLGGGSAREARYLQTTRAYFGDGEASTVPQRLQRFSMAWKSLAESHPDDLEARAFYSLALRAIADNNDASLAQQRQAGAIAESVLAENPNHPGAHHYIIHAYDFPALAAKALPVADHYGKITPRVPHATHMMTHIYTRLGQWEKAIDWNNISAESAWDLCVQSGEISPHYTHSLDYLAYAYLQLGQDQEVLEILSKAEQLQPPYSELSRAISAYAFAALPARYALERRDWEAAARLQPRTPATFPWAEAHDAYVAITHFARAIALARLGKPDEASADIGMLRTLRQRVATSSPYWAKQIEIQEQAALAWQSYARGDLDSAFRQMKNAVAIEASTEKHPVTPGEVLPAAELYGDMLLEAGRYDRALTAYLASLQRTPLRFNGLYGAAQAAMGMNDRATARMYFGQLVAMAKETKSPRPATVEAKKILASL